MAKMTVRDIDVTGKRVLVRVDFNVPFDAKTGQITDDSRIQASLPTIHYLIEHKAKIILMSHLGRPDGKVVESMRLAPVARRLQEILNTPVQTAVDCVGAAVEKQAAELKAEQILLLENLRFHPEEEEGDANFAQALSKLGDIYVNDAFGTSHRTHASISGITKYLPAVAGFLLEKEITYLGHAIENPIRPFAALIGGAKISDKVKMLERISQKVDYMLIGGGMAGTFLKAQGKEIGKSLLESDRIETARSLVKNTSATRYQLLLPTDFVVADAINGKQVSTVPLDKIPKDKMIVDIGEESASKFAEILKKCHTVFWNGPMGVYENGFSSGTQAMALTLANLKATTIIGGGSTAEYVASVKLTDKMTFVSTGGGASLSFVSGEKLPGVESLMDKKN